jgi:hypothetical protein
LKNIVLVDPISKNIVLDLICSFLLQVASQFKQDVKGFIGSDPDTAVRILVDVLKKHGVCRSEEEARLASVPALISGGVLTKFPEGFKD